MHISDGGFKSYAIILWHICMDHLLWEFALKIKTSMILGSFIMRMGVCFKDKSMHDSWSDYCNPDEWEQSFS